MILSDREIRMEIDAGNLVFDPPVGDDDFSTTAVDLHLGSSVGEFRPPDDAIRMQVDLSSREAGRLIDPRRQRDSLIDWKEMPINGHEMRPGQFVLAFTQERVTLPSHLAARVEGRSTIARFGISIHSAAPTVHATFSGYLVLEISNHGPMTCLLVPGMKVCQLIIERVSVPSLESLESQWMRQGPPAP